MRFTAFMPTAFVSSFLLLFVACGPKTTNLAPEPSKKVSAPDWYLNPPEDPSYLYATSSMTSRDMQLAVQKAETQARTDLAQQMQSNISNLNKQFQEEVGLGEDSEMLQQFTSVTKSVTQQTLNGSRTDRKELVEEKGIYRAYVLMSLPIGTANQQLMEKIRANENLYTRFRSTQAFEELDEEIEKLNK